MHPCAPALGGFTLLKLDSPRFAAGGESCRPQGLTRAPGGRPGRGDSRGVVTFPLPEAGSRPTRTAAHAPGAPRAPVPVHVLRDGRLAHALSRAAPLKHSRPFHVRERNATPRHATPPCARTRTAAGCARSRTLVTLLTHSTRVPVSEYFALNLPRECAPLGSSKLPASSGCECVSLWTAALPGSVVLDSGVGFGAGR